MGQLYTAIVWGAMLQKPDDVFFKTVDNLTNWVEKPHRTIKISYESKPWWVGVMLADSDGNINTYFEEDVSKRTISSDPYEQVGFCFYRQAFKLFEFEQIVNRLKPGLIESAKKQWDSFSSEMAKNEICLPDPDFLLINDWR